MKLIDRRKLIPASLGLVFGLSLATAANGSPTTLGVKAASATTSPAGTTMNFPLTRTASSDYDLFLGYHADDGSAVAGTDYVAPTAPLLLPAGQTVTAPVDILPSAAYYSGKTFQLILDSALAVGPAPSFAALKNFGTDATPDSIAAADFNGDGKPDVAVASTAGKISALIN